MEKKVYIKPKFELVRNNESNKVFFAGSPVTKSFGIKSVKFTTGEF